ncbi:hypothetical protein PPYR_05157 [Photinus pyralis]|uniref:Integrase catalytic domain-containing protein n=1 Tax=Photinus pyralis TaxID=7054 RepID=A0A5N4B035_PHOPY|nr:hypothetical protein PPYR_05157 [Photinus pyralis]
MQKSTTKQSHPILLDGKHILSKLIILHTHKQLMHAGPSLLLSNIRQNYWITNGVNSVKGIIRKCVTCFRYKPKPLENIMANLPENRLKIAKPSTLRELITQDRICLGIAKVEVSKNTNCKAIHIELVTDLTTEAFIAALRRFVARRGKPEHIFSDNATNFVGSNKEIQNLYKFLKDSENDIFKLCSNENIAWSFISANSTHHGGLWEAAVKSIKTHLIKIIGKTHLLFEELQTIVVQIEATLNFRPLYAKSSDPNDMQPLTPSHFLIGKSITMVPDPSLDTIPLGKLSRFQLLQHIQQVFWKRWSVEYFASLQQRNKWKIPLAILVGGALVLIKQDNLPPGKWLMGRVLAVHPGNDGVVRIATIRTSNGVLKRAITRLCVVPLENTAPVHGVVS